MKAWVPLALSAMALAGPLGAQIPKPDDAPQALDPEESRKEFVLPPGFRIDLIASEPLIADPSCVAWDEHGRLFVTEIHGYNLEGQLDITELNMTGQLDTAIRRVRVDETIKAEARKGQHGSLKLLRDTDGDGRMDEAILWADDIPPAYGVVAARGGVIVLAEPEIWFFADRNGDDRVEVRELLFSGFERGEMERGINNPVWGPDNWIYAGRGWGGATVTGPHLPEAVRMGRNDFRFKPDGSAIEPVSGENHTFGMSFDDWGNRFLITTGQPVRYAAPLPYRYLARNPHVPSPETTIGASPYHNTFPISEPHPWRRKRGADPRWVKFYGAGEAQPNGNFTSACGQQVYRAALFPEQYRGNHFACEPQQNLVHRSILERDGPGLRARRPDELAGSEFLASPDGWFRPTNLRVGPDGALYIVDMYREIIEDYSAIPRYLQQQYGLMNGSDRGRIWRLAPESSEPEPVRIDGLRPVASLRHSNSWWRETAQRLLVEDRESGTKGELSALVTNREAPFPPRVHALYTLDGRGELGPAEVIAAMSDPHPAVRMHALRLGERWFESEATTLQAALALAGKETDHSVLLQLALSFGESMDPEAVQALARLSVTKREVRWMESAVLSSIGRTAAEFLRVILADYPEAPASLVERATETAVRGDGKGSVADVLTALANHPDEALRLRLLALAATQGLENRPELRAAADQALEGVGDAARPLEIRLAALRLVPFASPESRRHAVAVLTDPQLLPEIQEDGLRTLLQAPHREVAAVLIERLPGLTPRAAATVTEGLLANAATARQLLEAKVLSAGSYSAVQRHRLQNHADAGVRTLARALFTSAEGAESDPRHAAHFEALGGEADMKHGAELFALHCAACHSFGGTGYHVGPPLDGEAGRPAESLLADILNPSQSITAGYATFLVTTTTGGSHAGVLAAESATSLTLMAAGGAETVVLRRDLAGIERLELSLMPATFAEALRPEETADLVAYLKRRPASGPVVLFDDDPGFPGLLADGRGAARIDWRDAASGRACLTVEGFQRYARQLPGWAFAIRETPRDGEFRYLQIALKTRGSKGMMLELASDGIFPAESEAIRTYFAGDNATGWKSNRLAPEIPADWQTFTIDLWKDNGDFTLTGMAFTVMDGEASYDRIELRREAPSR